MSNTWCLSVLIDCHGEYNSLEVLDNLNYYTFLVSSEEEKYSEYTRHVCDKSSERWNRLLQDDVHRQHQSLTFDKIRDGDF